MFSAVTDYATTQNTIVFEVGSTSESKAEIIVMPDVVFETNETYILSLFIRRSTINRLNLMLMNSEALVTIENDDSEYINVHVCTYAYTYIATCVHIQ